MKYCPQCRSEYRPGFERCPDCQQDLVDELPAEQDLVDGVPTERELAQRVAEEAGEWEQAPREQVFISGRRLDAELARGRLDADGIDARIWGGGMGVWRLESSLTEMTGVPNAFNSYRVMVPEDDAERAREILAMDHEVGEPEVDEEPGSTYVGMDLFRSRWILVGIALFLLFMLLRNGFPV